MIGLDRRADGDELGHVGAEVAPHDLERHAAMPSAPSVIASICILSIASSRAGHGPRQHLKLLSP
jgi:hypothetical protein